MVDLAQISRDVEALAARVEAAVEHSEELGHPPVAAVRELDAAVDQLQVRVGAHETPELVRAKLRGAAAVVRWLGDLGGQPERREAFARHSAPLITPPTFSVTEWPAEVSTAY